MIIIQYWGGLIFKAKLGGENEYTIYVYDLFIFTSLDNVISQVTEC